MEREKGIDVTRKAIVVGAGIAGLTAAYRLQQYGLEVKVLESSPRVGGRMSTDRAHGHIVDRGAQFLTTRYSTMMPLIRELGLQEEVVPTAPYQVIVKNGLMQRLKLDNLWARLGYAVKNVGGPWNVAKLLANGSPFLVLKEKRKDDYTLWETYDDEDASQWWAHKFGLEGVEYLLEPLFEGFFFHPPEGASKALALLIASFNMAKGEILTMKRGLGSVTEALAAQLDVELNTPVLEVRRRHGTKPLVVTGSGAFETDYVVLAAPAPIAQQILAEPTPFEKELLETPYASTIVVTIATSKNWSKSVKALRGAYGLLIPRQERDLVGAIGIETNKCASHTEAGELLNIMTEGVQSPELMDKSDEEILDLVLRDLEAYFPGVSESVTYSTVIRWKHAQTKSPVGRARLVGGYRRKVSHSLPVVLAGDYMGIGSTDSAAQTGCWAAEAIRDHQRVHVPQPRRLEDPRARPEPESAENAFVAGWRAAPVILDGDR
jgi:oxygen-dependent protoporphyrinogen oxidase